MNNQSDQAAQRSIQDKFTFVVRVTPESLRVAKALCALAGPPHQAKEASSIGEESEFFAHRDVAEVKWAQVLNELQSAGISPSKLKRVLGSFRPVGCRGTIITLDGPFSEAALQLLEKHSGCGFCFIINH